MNNEEIMVLDSIEIEDVEVNTEVEPIEESGSGIGGVIGGALALAAAGFLAWKYSKSDKRTERQIKKLEKKGYTVTVTPAIVEDEVECVEHEVVQIDTIEVK